MHQLTTDPRRLWLVSLIAILAIVAVGIVIARNLPGYAPSPIGARLAAAAIVTVLVAVAKVVRGPRAAAVTGVLGTLVPVVLLIAFG